MKQFLVFICEEYYPKGAKRDYIGAFETLSNCVEIIKPNKTLYGFANVLDTRTNEWYTFKIGSSESKWVYAIHTREKVDEHHPEIIKYKNLKLDIDMIIGNGDEYMVIHPDGSIATEIQDHSLKYSLYEYNS